MKEIEKRQHYRNIFFSPSGREVLIDILKHGYFFNFGEAEVTADMPEALGKRNLCSYILNMLGCADEPEQTMIAIIDGISKVPILAKTQNEEEEND